MICSDCHHSQFVQDSSDGSIVCKNCGLVASHHMLVDPEYGYSTTSNKKDDILIEALYKFQIENDTLENVISETFYELKNKFPKHSLNALRAIALSDVTNISKKNAQNYFNVNTKQLNQIHVCPIEKELSIRITPIISAFLPHIDKCKKMKIIRKINETNQQIKDIIQSKKPCKIDPIIFFFVASNFFDIKIDPHEICSFAHLSIVTFHNHLKLISKNITL